MFARKKPEPTKQRKHDLSQFGLTDIPDDFDPSAGLSDEEADSDLVAELARIAGGEKPKPKQRAKPHLMPASDLDKMIANSLRDIESDDDDEENDDPDLLGELRDIAGDELEDDVGAIDASSAGDDMSETQIFLPTTTTDIIGIIKQRIEMYKLAEANANAAGEASKARRFNRGLKTLNDQLKQASAGKTISVDDMPPEVSVKGGNPATTETTTIATNATETPSVELMPKMPLRPAPLPPPLRSTSPKEEVNPPFDSSDVKAENPVLSQMNRRRTEYKAAALNAKRFGDTATALQFLKVVKQFDMVIKMCEEGQEVDLSDMPPPPEEFMEFLAKMQSAEGNKDAAQDTVTVTDIPADKSEQEPEQLAVKPPATMLEALEERLEKYRSVEESAKAENNTSKARRFGRIVKQYEDAIKRYKAGKPIAYDELPAPPGFGPLPIPGGGSEATSPEEPKSNLNTPSPSTDPPTSTAEASPSNVQPPPAEKPELTTRISGNKHSTNLAEQQMKILLDRQKEFKVAAFDAKKAGEIDQAKEYLKIYKGFEALLNAASNGLPVDLNTLPVPPSQRENLEASFAIVNPDDCDPNDDISDIGVRIEEQLAKQLMMCKNTRDHHKAMADVAGMNRFENLALTVQKDLDLVRYSKRKNFPLPKFHYEKKSFNIVHCNTDLTDNEVEIVVVRGINYNVANPKDVDTYVKLEFPYPQDDFFKAKTPLVKDTDNPDYDQRYKVEIQRSNRQCQRIFKRQAVKFEVYSRGCCCGFCRILPMCCFSGFLRSDILIGTVNVKLQPLETKCDIHDTFDLMDGRKVVGGKLEIKVRARNPILTKQIEHINEKWLVLDS